MKTIYRFIPGYVKSFLVGSFVLIVFSYFQKVIAGFPITVSGFYVPFVFGGLVGAVIYRLFAKIRRTKKELAQALIKTESANHLKSEFLRNLSHEIRTPMNGILGFSQLLEQKDISEQKKQQYLNYICQNGNQLVKIIDDIVDISKISSKDVICEPEKIDLAFFCDCLYNDFSRTYSYKKSISFRVERSETAKQITTDRHLLRKILEKIIDNAFKYTSSGTVELKCYLKGAELIFEVSDTGIGIDKKEQATAFDTFTRKVPHNSSYEFSGGTGVGLAIVKGLISLLNGRIELDSDIGKGSTFKVIVPSYPTTNQQPDYPQ